MKPTVVQVVSFKCVFFLAKLNFSLVKLNFSLDLSCEPTKRRWSTFCCALQSPCIKLCYHTISELQCLSVLAHDGLKLWFFFTKLNFSLFLKSTVMNETTCIQCRNHQNMAIFWMLIEIFTIKTFKKGCNKCLEI